MKTATERPLSENGHGMETMMMKMMRPMPSLAVALALVFAGCEDDPVEIQTFEVRGEVKLYDELAQPMADADQVTARLLGPGQSLLGEMVTSADGNFEFEVTEKGPYTLRIAKDGYGTVWTYDVTEGPESVRTKLYARSTVEVRSVQGSAYKCGDADCIDLAMEVDNFFLEGPTRRLFRMFMSTNPGVSWAGYEHTGLLIVTEDQPGFETDGTSATFTLDHLTGNLWRFHSGATVHIVIHGATENMGNSYFDPVLGLDVFTDLSPVSARTTIVVP